MALKDEYMTVSQAAKALGVTRQSVSRWIGEGKFTAEKVGRQKLIAKKDIDSFSMFLAQRLAEELIMSVDAFVGRKGRDIHIEGDIVSDNSLHATVTDKEGKTEVVEILREYGEINKRAKSKYRFRRVNKLPDTSRKYEPLIEIYYGVNKQNRIVVAGMRDLRLNKNKE